MSSISFLFYGVISAILLYAALLDFLYYRIPNKAFSFLFYSFIGYMGLIGCLTGQWELAMHFWVFAAGFAVTFLLFSIGFMGGGDAKFISAVMLWIEPEQWQFFLIAMALSGCIFAGLCFVCQTSFARISKRMRVFFGSSYRLNRLHQFLLPNLEASPSFEQQMKGKHFIPYGVAVSIGGLLTFWLPHLF